MVLKFKTNINLLEDIKIASPFLEDDLAITFWHVDTDNPDKILTVEGVKISEEEVIGLMRKAGFTASILN